MGQVKSHRIFNDRVTFLFEIETRKLKVPWGKIGKVFGGMFGGGDDDGDAYSVYKREENEQGE